MSTTISSIAAVLNSLIETCKDGQEGFRTAAENVQSADYKSLFFDLSMQRQEFVAELQSLVLELGQDVENAGSVAGAIHRGWIDLKAAVTSDDEHAILAECERGEDSAVAEYREALTCEALSQNFRDVILRQAVQVKQAHDRIRALRDSTKS